MDKSEFILLVLAFLFGILLGSIIPENKVCTVTITDMQGVHHVIKGRADRE